MIIEATDSMKVKDLMTRDVITVEPDDSLDHVFSLFKGTSKNSFPSHVGSGGTGFPACLHGLESPCY